MSLPAITSRCAITDPSQFQPCYASVLVLSSSEPEVLERRVKKLENKIWPNVTSWCLQCKHPCMITRIMHEFKTVSEHHTHVIVLQDILVKSKLFD